jgi:hypothetical protein
MIRTVTTFRAACNLCVEFLHSGLASISRRQTRPLLRKQEGPPYGWPFFIEILAVESPALKAAVSQVNVRWRRQA